MANRGSPIGQHGLFHSNAFNIAQHHLNLRVRISRAIDYLLDAVTRLFGKTESVEQCPGSGKQQQAYKPVSELLHLLLLSADALDEPGKLIFALEFDLDLVLSTNPFDSNAGIKSGPELSSCAFK